MSTGLLLSGTTFYVFPTRRHAEVEDLVQLILDHGGEAFDYHKKTYDDNDPTFHNGRGIALIDPSQPYAPGLFEKQARPTNARNTRLEYINWGYIRFCLNTEELLSVQEAMFSLVFNRLASNDGGWRIHLSDQLELDESGFDEDVESITLGGGQVVEDKEEADIIILPQEPTILKEGRDEYQGDPYTRVEGYTWLIESVRRQYVKFTPPKIKTMPGAPGKRNQFTEEDKRHLVRYLAMHCNPSGRGKKGDNLYRRMCREQPWARTHPWSSWQTHYKKNSEKFDEEIKKWEYRHPAKFADGHGRDMRRNPPQKRRIPPRRLDVQALEDESEEGNESDDHDDLRNERPVKQTFPPSRKRRWVDTESEGEQPPPSSVEDHALDYQDEDRIETSIGYQFDAALDAVPKSTPPPRLEAKPRNRNVPILSHGRHKPQQQSSRVGPAPPLLSAAARSDRYYGIPSDEEVEEEEDTVRDKSTLPTRTFERVSKSWSKIESPPNMKKFSRSGNKHSSNLLKRRRADV